MRDIDLFTKLLALERPWTVSNVILEAMDESVHVLLDHRSNARFHCLECDTVLPLHDHSPLRQWRHLDHGSWLAWVHARIPRIACPVHGVRQVRLPWTCGNRSSRRRGSTCPTPTARLSSTASTS